MKQKKFDFIKSKRGVDIYRQTYDLQSESSSHIVLCKEESIETKVLTKSEFELLIIGVFNQLTNEIIKIESNDK